MIVAISDLHGTLPEIDITKNIHDLNMFSGLSETEIDLVLLAGDNVSLLSQSYKNSTEHWYKKVFVDWVNKLPLKDGGKVIWIAGNHECAFYESCDRQALAKQINELTNGRAIYLEDSSYTYNGITIYGSPWCTIFGNWAFMLPTKALEEKFSKMPKGIDILLTHDAPYGVSDMCYGWIYETPRHIGNKPLRDAILDKQPKLHLHGHLHSTNHNEELLGNTSVYCVSLLDENYKATYQPMVIC